MGQRHYLSTTCRMKNRNFKVATLSILFSLAFLTAQSQQEYTLQECIDYALEHNLSVQNQELLVMGSAINAKQAKMDLLPSVNGSAQYGYNWGRSINPGSNIVTRQEQQNGFGSLNASLNLFNGGRVINNIKMNNVMLQTREFDLENSKNDVILSVVTFYTNVIFNKELLENAQTQLVSTTTQLERTRKQVDAGALPISSLLDLQAQQANNEVAVIQAQNNLNLSYLQLKQALMLPGDVDLAVVVPEIELDTADFVTMNAQKVYEIAEATMPDVRSADLQIQSAELGIVVAKANYMPRLTLSGGVNTNYSSLLKANGRIENTGVITNVPIGFVQSTGATVVTPIEDRVSVDYPVNDILADNFGQGVSLSLSIPIFNNLQVNSAVQRAKITRDQAELQAAQIRQNLRQTIEIAYNDVYSSGLTYQSNLKQVAAQQEAFRATKQRFDNGAANYAQYELAENNLFQARSDLIRAKYNYIFKLKILDFYQGKEIDF